MAKVNIDALIPREDFDVEENINSGKKKDTLSIEDLHIDSFFFSTLRKPDFQRETNEWDPKKICEFVESFLDGDLIPAIILWRSTSNYLFVIDGSHRLSSLAAWINDDYGDGKVSKAFYDGLIPEEQLQVADAARKLIKKRIGTYEDFKLATRYPDKVLPKVLIRAKNLAAISVQLQWVEGDASKAEHSFFKINQQAAPIDKTELALLESRKKPNCIAARAIIKSGKGHKYWAGLDAENQKQVQELAKINNEILFSPKLQTPVKTLDIPLAGKVYSAQSLPLVLDFVNIVNNIESNFKDSLQDDFSGDETVSFLKNCRKISQRINSDHPSSLGLHPIVYFYSQDGRHKPASFYAVLSFVIEMEKLGFKDFISVRPAFESFLLQNDNLIQVINRRYRYAISSYPHIRDLYFAVIELLKKGISLESINSHLVAMEQFSYIGGVLYKEEVTTSDFSQERKSAVFIREALATAPRCKICGGYIHRNSISIDHIKRKSQGGLGTVDNGQISHPYCNSTYKQ